jgi:hypothetical protein
VVVRPLTVRAPGGEAPSAGVAAQIAQALAAGANIGFFAFLPFALLIMMLWGVRHSIAFDLHEAFRPAAAAVLDGESPYPPPTAEALATRTAWVYLPFASFLFIPFALMPPLVADLVATAAVGAAGGGALWILGVRDWRCYGIALASLPVLAGIQTANLTLPLALALAAVWVLRARSVGAGLVLASTLATKLFLWPLFVWLAATRRYRAAAVSAGSAALMILVSWAALGFAGARDYPAILGLLADALESDSYTPFALAHDLHAPEHVARAIGFVIAGAALVGSWVLGRGGDDRRSFTLAVVAALLFTPIVWLHYFALLFVPVAVVRDRLSALWAVPLAPWLFAEGYGNGTTAQTALMLATFGVLVALTLRTTPQHRPGTV